jgi:hypothetical protein
VPNGLDEPSAKPARECECEDCASGTRRSDI